MIINVGFLNNLVGTTLAACCLAISFGNLNGWSSPVVPKLENNTSDNPFDEIITKSQASWMSSLLTLGAVIGCWIFGSLSDVFGRRLVFISFGAFTLLGYVLMAAAPKVEVFYVARFLQGLCIGGGTNLNMTYLGEICSKDNRGIVMTLSGMMVSSGALFCYAVGPYVSVTTFNLVQMTFPIVYLLVSSLFCEESPYFYLIKNEEELAKKALKTYRGPKADFESEIEEMKAQIKEQKEGKIMDIIRTSGYKKAVVIGAILLIGQQLTGINAILMYSQTIFDLTGSTLSSEVCSMIIASIQLISGAIAPFMVYRFDRKTILLFSGLGMIISELVLGIYCILKDSGKDLDSINFLPLLTLTMYMFTYNFGFGPLCWVIPGEIMPARVKVATISMLISIYYGTGFFIAQFFNSVVEAIGIGVVFLIFSGCCFVCCLFIKFFVLETRGKSLEEIQDILNGRKQ